MWGKIFIIFILVVANKYFVHSQCYIQNCASTNQACGNISNVLYTCTDYLTKCNQLTKVCSPVKLNGEACTDHGQCQSSNCKNGTCWGKKPGGSICNQDADCRTMSCQNNLCSYVNDGSRCNGSTDCNFYVSYCNSGVCTRSSLQGQHCNGATDCIGFDFAADCANNQCLIKGSLQPYDKCDATHDCGTGLACRDNQCTPMPDQTPGGNCTTDHNCTFALKCDCNYTVGYKTCYPRASHYPNTSAIVKSFQDCFLQNCNDNPTELCAVTNCNNPYCAAVHEMVQLGPSRVPNLPDCFDEYYVVQSKITYLPINGACGPLPSNAQLHDTPNNNVHVGGEDSLDIAHSENECSVEDNTCQ